MADSNIYEERRKKLAELAKDGFVVIFSGIAPMKSLDEAYDFAVDRNFYYFTGIDRENMIFFQCTEPTGIKSYIFIERCDELKAKWVGERMSSDEAGSISGIDNIMYIDEYDEFLAGKLTRARGREIVFMLDLWKNTCSQQSTPAHELARRLQKEYPNVIIKDIYNIVTSLRIIKSDYELSKMRQAQKATGNAIKEMLLHVKPGMNECEIEGAFDFALAKQCIREHAFKTIVAGGERATVLHYSENNNIVNDGELVLVDLGCSVDHYSADISRTFPVNGRFTDRQRMLYDIVLNAQKLIISLAKPGITIKDLNNEVINFYEKELDRVGLLKDGKKVSDYYYHNISHQLGLDTHDVFTDDYRVLQKGMVITVEPGLYVREENTGIRIEDDILITEDGAVNLSEDILKEPDDIENFMNGENYEYFRK